MKSTTELAFERHYSVEELAEIWKVSDSFIRRLFLHEPDVVVFFHQRPGRRVYRTLRIPESVAQRVHERMRGSDAFDFTRNTTARHRGGRRAETDDPLHRRQAE